MKNIDEHLLKIINEELSRKDSAYNIRKDGKSIDRASTDNIKIESKKDKEGIDIYVKEGTLNGYVHIPVILTKGGFSDKVYNDFHIQIE